MKAAALLALLVSLAAAPLAPAATLSVQTTCASQCCETNPDCCATACPCPPASCQTQGATGFLLSVNQPLFVCATGHVTATQLTDDACSVRTSRPPVPPPRA